MNSKSFLLCWCCCQVTDICKKESAMYARYALMLMVDSGYQGRMGICTAGHYGCSQVRSMGHAIFWLITYV
jgi:hypothetical protein